MVWVRHGHGMERLHAGRRRVRGGLRMVRAGVQLDERRVSAGRLSVVDRRLLRHRRRTVCFPPHAEVDDGPSNEQDDDRPTDPSADDRANGSARGRLPG